MPMVSVVGYGECGCGADRSRPVELFFARPLGAEPRSARHPHGRKVSIIDWDLPPVMGLLARLLATRHTKRGRISTVGGASRSVTLPNATAT